MSGTTHTEPPRWEHAPGGGLPDNLPSSAIGGYVQGGGGAGGSAELLDQDGGPAKNVMENSVRLSRVSDDLQAYMFTGVPEGTYRVRVTLDTGATKTTGPVQAGGTAELLIF